MSLKYLEHLNSKKFILGSGSAQRKKILADLGIKFDVIISNFAEDLEKTHPTDYVSKTCLKKFEDIIQINQEKDIDILVTVDTIIVQNNKILEKPKDEEEILQWFRSYSNNTIFCYSSVVIGIIQKNSNNKNFTKDKIEFITESKVFFDEITDDNIKCYIDSGEPYNKAGGFGIQGLGSLLIKGIEGCYYNIVGFPINDFFKHLRILVERQE